MWTERTGFRKSERPLLRTCSKPTNQSGTGIHVELLYKCDEDGSVVRNSLVPSIVSPSDVQRSEHVGQGIVRCPRILYETA